MKLLSLLDTHRTLLITFECQETNMLAFRSPRATLPLVVGIFALTMTALLGACQDSAPSSPTAPVRGIPVRPDGQLLAAAPTTKDNLPTGKGVDVQDDPNPPPRTRYKVEYHGAQVLKGTQQLYALFYGSWPQTAGTFDVYVDFLSNLGGTPYFQVATKYPNALGEAPSGELAYGGAAIDAYSHGPTLSDADIADLVSTQILASKLPLDPSGIYIIIASPDVWASSGMDVTYCAMHGRSAVLGTDFRYVFVGGPARSPTRCAPQSIGPNSTLGADAAVSLIAAEVFNTVTDPTFASWYDRLGLEPADKCAWTFGTTYTAPNGARANVKLGSRHYLLQQLWLPSKSGGSCALKP
jgi:hypothetical protein